MWGIEIDVMSVWDIEIDLISVKGSELTWFLCEGRKWLVFGVWIEIIYVWGLNWFDPRVGIEIDLMPVLRSKVNWLFVWGIEIDLIFSMGIEIYLVFVRGVKIDSVFVCEPKIACFRMGIDWLGFCVGVENELVFVCGLWSWDMDIRVQQMLLFIAGNITHSITSSWWFFSGIIHIS